MGKARGIFCDSRGAHLVEYLIVVGLVALLGIGALRLFGKRVTSAAETEGQCVQDLSSNCKFKPGGPGVFAASIPQPVKRSGGNGVVAAIVCVGLTCMMPPAEREEPPAQVGFNEAEVIKQRGQKFYTDHAAKPGSCPGCHGPDEKPPGEKTKTEWQDKVLGDIGVSRRDLRGYTDFTLPNQAIMKKIYGFYSDTFKKNPNMLWAGMGVLAGHAVWQGQVDNVKTRAWIPSAHTDRIAKQLEMELMQMNLKIFLDLGWMHEAYLSKGLPELEARFKAGDIDEDTIKAWRLIDKGIKNKNDDDIQAGNKMLLLREQKVILKEGYENIKRIPGNNLGRTMGAMAESPVPGGQRFSRVVPGGNLADFKDRWKWIESEMVPNWNSMSPEDRLYYVDQPVDKPLKPK